MRTTGFRRLNYDILSQGNARSPSIQSSHTPPIEETTFRFDERYNMSTDKFNKAAEIIQVRITGSIFGLCDDIGVTGFAKGGPDPANQ